MSGDWQDVTLANLNSQLDHGTLLGLADDDHTQYHTDARALTWLGTRSTSDLPEGSRLYFTDERAQDAVFTAIADSSSIDVTYNDAGNSFSIATINANPSGLIGMTAVNGTAATPLRSDGRHAIDPAIAPTWTGRHVFNYTSGAQILTGTTTANSNPTPGSPEHLIDFVNDRTSFSMQRWSSYGTGGVDLSSQNGCHFMRARGTLAAPTVLKSGDTLGALGWRGHDGTNVTGSVADFRVDATEDWSGTAVGAKYIFEVVPTGTTARVVSLEVGGDFVTSLIGHKFTKIGSASAPSLSVENTVPVLQFKDTDAAVDEKTIQLICSAGLFIMRKNDDANTTNRRFLEMQSSGAAISALIYGNSTDNPSHTFNGAVLVTGGNVRVTQDNKEVQIGAGNDLRLYHDGTDSYIENDTGKLRIYQGSTEAGRFDSSATANDTRFLLYDVTAGAIVRVSRGAADSGGVGFRLLRIPN